MKNRRIYTSNGCYPGMKLKGKNRYKKLYHYTSFDTFVKIWLTKQLKFGIITNVNDIQEVDISSSCINFKQIPLLHAYNDLRTKYKQISFTMDYDSYIKGCMSPMMWGVYGDKRRGVCIEFDYDKIDFPKEIIKGIIQYKHILHKHFELDPYLKTQKDIRSFMYKHRKELMFTKHKSWSGENEYRILSDRLEYLNIENAINTIYLTSNDSLECILVEKIVKNEVPVKYMHYIQTADNLSIPVLSETKSTREQFERIKNSNSYSNKIAEKSMRFYEERKNDENAVLLMDDI